MVETIGTGIVNSIINSAAFDPVAIYDLNYQQVFRQARPIKATVKPDSKSMDQPLETGTTVADHRILLPIEIELSLILSGFDYQDIYQEIRELFRSAQLLIVQTKVGVFENLIITSMPHEEDAALFDTVTLALRLKEVMFANTDVTFAPRDGKKAGTKDRGNQQVEQASGSETQRAGSWAGSWKVFGG